MRLTALIISLLLFDVIPAQAGPHGGSSTHAAPAHQPSHHMQPGLPGTGRNYQTPNVRGVYSARPGNYSSNDRYSGGRAVYAAYSSAGYGPYGGGRRGYGGFGGGFGGGYNIEMQRLLEHQFELRAIGQYLPINTVAPQVMYNPNFVPRASQLDPDATVHPAPKPLTVTNPFSRPAVAQQAEEPPR
jgi:hypothetical protein